MKTPDFRAIGLIALAFIAGCAGREERSPAYPPLPGRGEFSVMIFNLDRFAMADRNGNGQPDNFKPRNEIEAVVDIIRQARPDILAVQEIGTSSDLETLRDELAKVGCDYPHADHLAGPAPLNHLAILSRFPVSARLAVTNLSYTIQGATLPIQRGFQQIDLEVAADRKVRLINVNLKSKTFHVSGQTEMRRNEARLLATHARRLMREEPDIPVILCGSFNDLIHSSALRELTGPDGGGWKALSIRDSLGDDWTRDDRDESAFERVDFFLVADDLSERFLPEKSRVIRTPEARIASNHRPVVGTFSVD